MPICVFLGQNPKYINLSPDPGDFENFKNFYIDFTKSYTSKKLSEVVENSNSRICSFLGVRF